MATKTAARVSGSDAVTAEKCPYCGQPLLDREAVRRLHESERDAERKLEAAAKLKAAELTKALESEQKEKLEKLEDQLATTKAKHADELRDLRITLLAEAKTEAERAAEARVRREMREKDRAIAKFKEQVEVQTRQIEHLTSDERGELNEENLLQELRTAFPDDHIERRGRGKSGGDILHQVRARTGDGPVDAGLIVYECKDTLAWSNRFLDQARREGATHKTPYLVIITRAFPRNEKTLCVRDGVVIVHPSRAIELAHIMRRMVQEIHRVALTAEGKALKDAELYAYLTSADFRQAFDGLATSSDKLADLLVKERRWHEQSWARRQAIHNELSSKTTAIDTHIRAIVEKQEAPGTRRAARLREVA
jgi:hypothetical protein